MAKPSRSPPLPTVPPMDPSLQRKMLGRLYWIRVGFAAVGGFFSGLVGLVTPVTSNPNTTTLWNNLKNNVANPNAYYGAYIAIFVFLITYYLARYSILKGINPKDKNRLITQGIGSYIMMFIFSWILFNTYHFCMLLNVCHP
ncbi:MAG TPA: hypothetical protein VED17_06365 [Nitrososphaerales archaeon]|nr:hypothetical protein [Nitrososphaerales archaeon]